MGDPVCDSKIEKLVDVHAVAKPDNTLPKLTVMRKLMHALKYVVNRITTQPIIVANS